MGNEIIPLGPASGKGYFEVSSSLDATKTPKAPKGKSKDGKKKVTGSPASSTLASGLGVGTELFGDALKKARKDALKESGLYRPRQKYESKEDRKAAAKARAKERREKKRKILIEKGLGPRPKKKYDSVDDRKAAAKGRRKERRANRREFIIEVAKDNPELAAKYGIDLSKFKLFGQGL